MIILSSEYEKIKESGDFIINPQDRFYGTKWDFDLKESNVNEVTEERITLSPSTAWSPPSEFCQKLTKKYGVSVTLDYEEGGVGFVGQEEFEDGEMIGQISPEAPFEAVSRVEVHATCVHIIADVQQLLGRPASAPDAALEVQQRTPPAHRVMVEAEEPAQLRLINPVRLALRGGRKLVLDAEGRRTGGEQRPDAVLIRALRTSHEHLTALGEGPIGRPEQAQLALPAIHCPAPVRWPAPRAGEPPLRPLFLFDPPQPVEVVAEVPDGPPHRFRWKRNLHEVRLYEGPERIASEWWKTKGGEQSGRGGLTRDYYRIEDARGRRYWIFRHGLYEEKAQPKWYLHGLFA